MRERCENVRLQKRISNMRATYRRFVGSLQKNLEENQRRRQETNQGVPDNVPRIVENRAGEAKSAGVRFQ
jgi:hypothetical protein